MKSGSISVENSTPSSSLIVMFSYVCQMEAFDPHEGEWSTYAERLEMLSW